MSNYSQASAGVSGSGDAGRKGDGYLQGHGMCSAPGCKLAGSLTTSTQGGSDSSPWFCRLHFGKPKGQWDRITNLANNRETLLKLSRELDRLPIGVPVPAGIRATLDAMTMTARDEPGNIALVDKAATGTAHALAAFIRKQVTHDINNPQLRTTAPSGGFMEDPDDD